MPNINFACRIVPVEQLLKCSLGLNEPEMLILKSLAGKKEEVEIRELSEEIRKDRTTIQRSLNSLHRKTLVKKRQINLSKGGYYYVYSSIPKKQVKDRIYENFRSFNKVVEDAIGRW